MTQSGQEFGQLLPVGKRSEPVPFGRVIRDGGETIELFVNPDQPMSSFYEDWTATHELSHMLLPYVARRDAWLSEGFASDEEWP